MPVALITGSANGIGRATVDLFRHEGWLVIGVDRSDAGRDGPNLFLQEDISDRAAIERIASQVRAHHTSLDALVNNAAQQLIAPLDQTTPDSWDAILNTNLTAAFLLIRAFCPLLRHAEGAIINVASVHALATSRGMSAYASTKGGLVALTRAAALELAPDEVRVNAVLPGAIQTRMLVEGYRRYTTSDSSVSLATQLASRHPLGRIGQPEDVAQAILFLADNSRSSFITGQVLVVDGGATAHLSTE